MKLNQFALIRIPHKMGLDTRYYVIKHSSWFPKKIITSKIEQNVCFRTLKSNKPFKHLNQPWIQRLDRCKHQQNLALFPAMVAMR